MILCILTLLSFSARVNAGNLKVGASKVDITPPVNPKYPPSGKYDHEKMNIRAIVLDNGEARAALIGADLADITTELWQTAAPQIAKILNCPIDNIIMSATHSHSSCPSGPPPPKFNEYNKDKMTQAMITAVKQAQSRLQTAKVAFGRGMAYLNVNRDAISERTRLWTQGTNLEGPSDKTVAIVMFETPDGKPIAGYMNYAMHANNAYLSGITSADFPGGTCCYIEKAFKNNMVMIFSQGASGDQNPLYSRPAVNALLSKSNLFITGMDQLREPIEYPLRKGIIPHGQLDIEVANNLERYIDALSIILGEEAIRVISHLTDWKDNVRIWGEQNIISLPGRKRVVDGGREGVVSQYSEGTPVKLRLGFLGIGDIALSTIDAEIYTRFGEQLKKMSPMNNTIFVTLANGRTDSGYIITDADYGKNTFQVLGNKLQPGHAETEIIKNLIEEINKYFVTK